MEILIKKAKDFYLAGVYFPIKESSAFAITKPLGNLSYDRRII